MQSLKYFSVLVFSLFVLLIGCKTETTFEDFQVDQGYDYFPLELGKSITYQVDSIQFDTTGMGIIVDSSSYQVRETVVDSFRDNTNRLSFLVEREQRLGDNGPWENVGVRSVIPGTQQLEVLEENLRFIKMVFPLEDGELWDGNQFIDPSTTIVIKGEQLEIFKGWSYEVEAIGEPEIINEETFTDVVTISQAESENVIERRFSMEKYARGIGLIYREMQIMDTQCISACEGLPWEQKAQKGFILRQSIIEYN